MKYIPLESFESINSLLQGVEALGCLVTIRLEAYTCRHTREEKQIATNLAQYYTNVQSTPPISPSPLLVGPAATFGADYHMELPPPIVLGSSAMPPSAMATSGAPLDMRSSETGAVVGPSTTYGGNNNSHEGTASTGLLSTPVVTAQDIDERLVFMVAALNSMYDSDGYDFSVLTERDFLSHTTQFLRDEVDLALNQLPEETCGPAVRQFWPAIYEQVGDAGQGCEVFEFNCPACDPRAETSVFSKQYFLYNKPRKILVSLLVYGEGNRYRGDDFAPDEMNPESRLHYASSPEPCEEDDGDGEEEYGGKNRDFYGY